MYFKRIVGKKKEKEKRKVIFPQGMKYKISKETAVIKTLRKIMTSENNVLW